jgi:DNA-binding GntR family transcriptional regulator
MVIKHRTLDSFVVDELRDRIVSGAMAAGTKIDQQALAEELGVSRMPVREALRRLSAEGFVELISHRGAVVAEFSHDEIIEIYEMRGVLQGLASRLALPHYTDEHVSELEKILARLDATKDMTEWIDLHRVFHERIETPSGAQHVLTLIERLTQQCAPYLQISVRFLHAEESAVELHHAILDAIVQRDAEGLEAAVRTHLRNWGVDVARYVQEHRTAVAAVAAKEAAAAQAAAAAAKPTAA